MPYADARAEFESAYTASFADRAQTKYLADLEKAGNIVVKDNAATIAKAVAANLEGNRENRTVIATSKAGDFTAARLARWIRAFPPQAQIAQQIQQQPDSMIPTFIKAIVRNELVLLQADSAKITLDSTELATLRGRFTNAVVAAWGRLNVDPSTLNDSGSTATDRERIAAARIDRYVDELLAERAQFIPIQEPLQTVLRDKYEAKINDAGLERAVERAMRVRATLDSTRALQQPQSQVPMPPGMRPNPTTPQGQPQPQQAPRP
jgi:peptidyl-prolyl cis-trans isomerase D